MSPCSLSLVFAILSHLQQQKRDIGIAFLASVSAATVTLDQVQLFCDNAQTGEIPHSTEFSLGFEIIHKFLNLGLHM